MRNHYLRNAVTLGTGLTALFLFVRCSVPERDFDKLNIGDHTGSGGGSGSGNDVTAVAGDGGLGGSGVLDGMGGLGALLDAGDGEGGDGGQGGTPPPPPVPCILVRNDAGSDDAGADAGTTDAGSEDAGTEASACECVDGFFRAVDTDGDGDGTRACTYAPGLDCDDNDPGVTHNSCGGCTVLPNAVGDDCGDCGTYACDGTDGLKCVSKPDPLVDPDCRCVAGQIVARDTDGDGYGTKFCEQNPGLDCNDGNSTFVTDACGGCDESPPGALGAACNQCGVYTCNGTAIVCGPNPSAGGHCTNDKNRQTCNSNGFWGNDADCANVCYQGNCELCTPGAYKCSPIINGTSILLYKCLDATSSFAISWWSWASCTTTTGCNATTGQCTGYLFLPRDSTFDLVPSEREGLPWYELLNTASDSDYG